MLYSILPPMENVADFLIVIWVEVTEVSKRKLKSTKKSLKVKTLFIRIIMKHSHNLIVAWIVIRHMDKIIKGSVVH